MIINFLGFAINTLSLPTHIGGVHRRCGIHLRDRYHITAPHPQETGECHQVHRGAYPLLRERLPTAYDNADSSGIVVDDPAEGASIDAGSVRRSVIISKKGLFLCMVSSLVLVSLLMFVSSPDAPRFITPEELESMITPPTDAEREEAADEVHQQQLMSELGSGSGSGSGDAEIYGKPSVAVIEGTNIELVMFSDAGVGHGSHRTESEPVSFISGTPVRCNTCVIRDLHRQTA